jgi:hypothetical protein
MDQSTNFRVGISSVGCSKGPQEFHMTIYLEAPTKLTPEWFYNVQNEPRNMTVQSECGYLLLQVKIIHSVLCFEAMSKFYD